MVLLSSRRSSLVIRSLEIGPYTRTALLVLILILILRSTELVGTSRGLVGSLWLPYDVASRRGGPEYRSRRWLHRGGVFRLLGAIVACLVRIVLVGIILVGIVQDDFVRMSLVHNAKVGLVQFAHEFLKRVRGCVRLAKISMAIHGSKTRRAWYQGNSQSRVESF